MVNFCVKNGMMDTFSTIRIKIRVAKKFRHLSKQIARNHSEAMEAMLNFFERNDLSPDDDLGIKNHRTNKRINAVIAIIKNIEKHQTKPTMAMLQSLFEQTTELEAEDEEPVDFGEPKLITEQEELTYYRDTYYKTLETLNALKYEMDGLMKRINYVKGSFGPGYFRLDISKEALETFKQKLDHVHHDNTPEAGR